MLLRASLGLPPKKHALPRVSSSPELARLSRTAKHTPAPVLPVPLCSVVFSFLLPKVPSIPLVVGSGLAWANR